MSQTDLMTLPAAPDPALVFGVATIAICSITRNLGDTKEITPATPFPSLLHSGPPLMLRFYQFSSLLVPATALAAFVPKPDGCHSPVTGPPAPSPVPFQALLLPAVSLTPFPPQPPVFTQIHGLHMLFLLLGMLFLGSRFTLRTVAL